MHNLQWEAEREDFIKGHQGYSGMSIVGQGPELVKYADPVTEFENRIAKFFGAPYAVAVDSCTHGLELCLRLKEAAMITCPRQTYLSVPMLANKLNIPLEWWPEGATWQDYYTIWPGVIDAAVLWRASSYIPRTFMCVSFQFQKHLSLSRGGVILCDNKEEADKLKRLSYDGRDHLVPWRNQDIKHFGLHYYMTQETATLGLQKLDDAIRTPPRIWSVNDWPDLTQMTVFKSK